MRALTICQPYASLIASGEKLVENRTWNTCYRGPLCIHAGKSREWLTDPPPPDMPFGAAIAIAELIDCLHINKITAGEYDIRYPWLRQHEHTHGLWCWILDKVSPLARPIPYKGALGLFEMPDRELQLTRPVPQQGRSQC